jgi:hypothetical protein
MREDSEEAQAYKRARKRVEELRDFYTHVVVYVVVNLGLFFISRLTGGGNWFLWPLLGWGIALLLHGVTVLLGGSFSERWETRKIRQYMERERTRGGPRPPQPQAP